MGRATWSRRSSHALRGGRRVSAALAVALLCAMPTAAVAQNDDLDLSCAPESVVAGTSTTCTVAGVTPSSRTTIEVRSGQRVVGQSSAIADTGGRATVIVAIPADVAPGTVSLALRGTTLTFGVTVTPGVPTGVTAGLSPSNGDVERGFPLTVLIVIAVATLLRSVRNRPVGAASR
jgi:hypothetical protein